MEHKEEDEESVWRHKNSTVFPHQITIEDCRLAIQGVPSFKETKTDQFVFFNYIFCTKESFPTYLNKGHKDAFYQKVRRECRGIVFDVASGKIVSRRFQKFFNVNEHEESKEGLIDVTQPHIILEKLDGSLVAPYLIDGKVSFGTKSGMTDIAKKIERVFLKASGVDYVSFCKEWLDKDYSPMFEWCSLTSQIVVRYTDDALVSSPSFLLSLSSFLFFTFFDTLNILTALRNNITGEYMSYPDMVVAATTFGVPVVSGAIGSGGNSSSSMQDILRFAKSVENAEGFVLRFDDGTMYKVKSDWYVERHGRQNSAFGDPGTWHEKNVWTYVLDKTLDDILSKMEEGERTKAARKFEGELWAGLYATAASITAEVVCKEANIPKREFVDKTNARQDLPPLKKAIYVKLYKEGCLEEVVKVVRKLAQKNTTLDQARCFAPGVVFTW